MNLDFRHEFSRRSEESLPRSAKLTAGRVAALFWSQTDFGTNSVCSSLVVPVACAKLLATKKPVDQ